MPWQTTMPAGWIILPVYLLIRILQKITLDLDRAIWHVILVASGDAYGKLLDWIDQMQFWKGLRDSDLDPIYSIYSTVINLSCFTK